MTDEVIARRPVLMHASLEVLQIDALLFDELHGTVRDVVDQIAEALHDNDAFHEQVGNRRNAIDDQLNKYGPAIDR